MVIEEVGDISDKTLDTNSISWIFMTEYNVIFINFCGCMYLHAGCM